jgi:hypothetical protein
MVLSYVTGFLWECVQSYIRKKRIAGQSFPAISPTAQGEFPPGLVFMRYEDQVKQPHRLSLLSA